MRRAQPSAESLLKIGELQIDLEKRTVTMRGAAVSVTVIVATLLVTLKAPGAETMTRY